MTEGILVCEMMADPLLRGYSVIMLDEVHERTLYTDVVLGLMKKIIKVSIDGHENHPWNFILSFLFVHTPLKPYAFH